MKISFFCKRCHRHLRDGNHDECKDILRQRERDGQRRAKGVRNTERVAKKARGSRIG